jgi:hypothetical protein
MGICIDDKFMYWDYVLHFSCWHLVLFTEFVVLIEGSLNEDLLHTNIQYLCHVYKY